MGSNDSAIHSKTSSGLCLIDSGEATYSKRLKLERDFANEYISCKQYLRRLNGLKKEWQKIENDRLRATVVNNAIERSFESGILKTLTELCKKPENNGTYVNVDIKPENWEALVILIGRVKTWGGLNELDLIKQCLKVYMTEMKLKGELP